jgi:large subunit ribosomal protein L23
MKNEYQYKLLNILKYPHVSDMAYNLSDKYGIFVFKVSMTSNKYEIKHAVETLFKVKVQFVHTLVMNGKVRKYKNILGKTKNWKKAYVKLMPGYDIKYNDI